MNKTINKIFDEAKVRISPTAMSKVGNGKKYKRERVLAKNRKLSDCIVSEDDESINDAIIEFLRNYIKVAELHEDTKTKLEEYINKIKKSGSDFQENTFANNCVTNEFVLESCFDNINIEEIEESNFNKSNNEEVGKTKKNTSIDESNTTLVDKCYRYKEYISLVASNEELWNSYSESNKKEIFKKLYENKYILGMLLEKIAEK